MTDPTRRGVLAAGAAAALAGCLEALPAPTADPFEDYEAVEVAVHTPGGELAGEVTAAVADTPARRYRGLGGVEVLPEGWGMLFVFEGEATRTFVMRDMRVGIDIVFADAEGTVTAVHHAPAPGPDEDGTEQRYTGTARYVLEVALGWTTDRGVGPGHRLVLRD